MQRKYQSKDILKNLRRGFDKKTKLLERSIKSGVVGYDPKTNTIYPGSKYLSIDHDDEVDLRGGSGVLPLLGQSIGTIIEETIRFAISDPVSFTGYAAIATTIGYIGVNVAPGIEEAYEEISDRIMGAEDIDQVFDPDYQPSWQTQSEISYTPHSMQTRRDTRARR